MGLGLVGAGVANKVLYPTNTSKACKVVEDLEGSCHSVLVVGVEGLWTN